MEDALSDRCPSPDGVGLRSAAWICATAETTLEFAEEASAAATGPDAKDALERLETRLDDLLAAMDWFLDAGRIDEAFRVANALYRFWITKQRFAEGAARVRASARRTGR